MAASPHGPLIREALDGYEQNRQGPGQHSFAELLASTHRSVIGFEMRDSYDQTVKGFAEWQATGDIGEYEPWSFTKPGC